MSLYKYVRDLWKQPKKNLGSLWQERLIKWRREPSTIRLDYPTRIDKARSLGYKAKQGYFVARQRVLRGGRTREQIRKGRRPRHFSRRKDLGMNYQEIAERRTIKKYVNCEVLNSYYVAKDGKYYWYEVILVDKSHPSIKADPRINWITEKQHTRRVLRGLTSAARKSRGLRSNRGKGSEKIRPSKTANLKRRKGLLRK